MRKSLFFLIPLMGAVLAVTVGCETESATKNSVSISPATTTMTYGESVEFTASGGYEYAWSLETSSYGTLSTRSGNTTVYTSLYNPGTNSSSTSAVTQVLTVTSTISGHSDTNASYAMTAEAYIRQE